MNIKFKNESMDSLITPSQLNQPGVITFTVNHQTEIPTVTQWLSANLAVTLVTSSELNKDGLLCISNMFDGASGMIAPDAVIVYGLLSSELGVIDIGMVSRSIGIPIILVTTKESALQRTVTTDENNISRTRPPEMFLSTCVTHAFMEGGEVFSLRNLRNIQTASGFELIV